MYSLALHVRVVDGDNNVTDETTWPLVQHTRNSWWRGVEMTGGDVFPTLTETVRLHTALKEALEEKVVVKNPLIKSLWESIVNTRGAVKQSGADKRVMFDLQIIHRKPTVLDNTPLDF